MIDVLLTRRLEYVERAVVKVKVRSEEELMAVAWDEEPAAERLADLAMDRRIEWAGGQTEYTYFPLRVLETVLDGEVDVDLTLSDEEYEAAR